jgi:hypothetical protein
MILNMYQDLVVEANKIKILCKNSHKLKIRWKLQNPDLRLLDKIEKYDKLDKIVNQDNILQII